MVGCLHVTAHISVEGSESFFSSSDTAVAMFWNRTSCFLVDLKATVPRSKSHCRFYSTFVEDLRLSFVEDGFLMKVSGL